MTTDTEDTTDDRSSVAEDPETMGALVHVSGLLTTILGPVLFLLLSDDEFVHENARNAVNWGITTVIAGGVAIGLLLVGIPLAVVLVGIPLLVLGGVLAFGVTIAHLGFSVVAAMKAADGEAWRYPLTYEFV